MALRRIGTLTPIAAASAARGKVSGRPHRSQPEPGRRPEEPAESYRYVEGDKTHAVAPRDLFAALEAVFHMERDGLTEVLDGLLIGDALRVATLEFRAFAPLTVLVMSDHGGEAVFAHGDLVSRSPPDDTPGPAVQPPQ